MTDTPLPGYAPLAEVIRSGFREGVHFGAVAGLAPDGTLAYERGESDALMLPRSSAKPFQALACLRADAPISGAALAIAAGSHDGRDMHVESVLATLAAAGLTEADLGCPADLAGEKDTRTRMVRAGEAPARVRMNCSGKHAAMLAACVQNGWSTADYLDPGHPIQRLVRTAIEELCGEPVVHTTVDGCGAPQLSVSLRGLAKGLQAMLRAPAGTPEAAVVDAMRAHPEYVAGAGRDDTVLMEKLPGAVAKSGAEGVIVITAGTGETAAVKLSDGDPFSRARTMVALTALEALGADITPAAALLRTDVTGGADTNGDNAVVGEIRPIRA